MPGEAPEMTGATPSEAPPASGNQSAGYTEVELRALMRDEMQTVNERLWAAVRQQLVPLQQRVGTIDSLNQLVGEVVADSKQSKALVRKLAEGTLSEEEVRVILQNAQDNLETSQLKADREALLEERRMRQDGEQQFLQQEQARNSPAARHLENWERYGSLAMEEVVAQGLDWEPFRSHLPSIHEGASEAQWRAWLRETKKRAAQEADKEVRTNVPRAAVPAILPAEGNAGGNLSNMARLERFWGANLPPS